MTLAPAKSPPPRLARAIVQRLSWLRDGHWQTARIRGECPSKDAITPRTMTCPALTGGAFYFAAADQDGAETREGDGQHLPNRAVGHLD